MRLKGLLLAGAAIPTVAMWQPAIARDQATPQNAPIMIAQQNQDKNDNKNENRQDKGTKQQQRQENRQQRQDNSEQRQEKRQEERGERREQKQEQRQGQQEQRQEQQKQRNQQRDEQRPREQTRDKDKDQQNKAQQSKDQPNTDQPGRAQQGRDRQGKDQQNNEQRRDRQQSGDQDRRRQQDQRQGGERQGEQRQEDRRQDRQRQGDQGRDDQRRGDGDRRPDRDNDARKNDNARKLDDVRGERRERKEGNRTIIEEGNRTIVRDGNRTIIRRDESDRFRRVGRDVNVQRVGSETRTVVVGPDGQRIVTVTDANGRLLRRSRFVNNREVVIIDNRPRGGRRAEAFFVTLPALAIGSLAIPRDRYIVEAESAPPEYIYGALMAPPVEALPRAYTLDEIRYNPEVRDRMPRIDLNTVTFDLGSWDITPDQYDRLAPIAEGIKRALARNPDEVFLIEGHTDATGNDDDNLSLSDRRAETVSIILTDHFQVPPENLATQGYGSQQLKVPTQAAERANRRVTVRRITPLLQQGQAAGGPVPR